MEALAEKETVMDEPNAATTFTPLDRQVASLTQQGMKLTFHTLDIVLPGKDVAHDNHLDLSGAIGQFKLDGLSLHRLSFGLHSSIDYNGLKRGFEFLLHNEEAYFSLSGGGDAEYDAKYKTSLRAYDEGGVDETTKGISYYEYGDLDYVISELLTTLGKSSILPSETSFGETVSFDWNKIDGSLSSIEEIDSRRFLWDLPLGEETLPIGLKHQGDYLLHEIEFPCASSVGQNYHEFHNGIKIRLGATISSESLDWSTQYPSEDYVPLVNSLGLFNRLAAYVSKKSFGFTLDVALRHQEDAIEGDEESFSKEAVDEAAYIRATAHCDFSDSLFGGLDVNASLGQEGIGGKSIHLHTMPSEDQSDTDVFLSINDTVKLCTSTTVFSAFSAEISAALSDESIQNDTIMELMSSLLSTANGVSSALDVIKASKPYKNIEEGHYEDLLSTIKGVTIADNRIALELDLSSASLAGSAFVCLNGDANNSLLSITLDNVGIKSDNQTHTSLSLSGELEIIDYQKQDLVDPSSYQRMSHIPSWTDQVKAIAESDQLKAGIEGYILTRGTHSPVTTSAWYGFGRSEQGLALRGEIAFDLKNRLGTGNLVLVDRKERFVNDHNLWADVTGEEGETDNDLNDLKGSGNHNAMFVKYHSRNVTAVSGSAAFNNENRADPESSASPLLGRFSIHSLNGILDTISNFSSTDARFERLTNLLSFTSATTVLNKILDGQYFELLSHDVLSSVTIGAAKSTFVVSPGFLLEDSGLTLVLSYGSDGKPTAIEVTLSIGEKDVYLKITLGETSFSSFPFALSSHNEGDYVNYSSLKTLIEYARDTITLGVTDDIYDEQGNLIHEKDAVTTYFLKGDVNLQLFSSSLLKITGITVDVFIRLKGTEVKILAEIKVPYVIFATKGAASTLVFYETDGSDSTGTLYMRHMTVNHSGFLGLTVTGATEECRVKGEDFSAYLLEWLLKYFINLTDENTSSITESDSSDKALHGEEIVSGFSVANASLTAPKWNLKLNVGKLANTGLIGIFDGNIEGLNATYSDAHKTYLKQTLYQLKGSLPILAGFISADLTFVMGNIIKSSSTNAYQDGWSVTKGAYPLTRKNKTLSDARKNFVTAESLWNGSTGISSLRSAKWKTRP